MSFYKNDSKHYFKSIYGVLGRDILNVLSVVSDKKIPKLALGSLQYFNPDIKAYNDYYPFGMLQPHRHSNTGDYRYGFPGTGNAKHSSNTYDK